MSRLVCASALVVTMALIGLGGAAFAQHGEGETHVEKAEPGNPSWGWIAVGAGLAVGLAGLGTGIAQSRIGAAGVGGIAEKPGLFGTVIVLVAIPESVLIFGFVIAYLLYAKM